MALVLQIDVHVLLILLVRNDGICVRGIYLNMTKDLQDLDPYK